MNGTERIKVLLLYTQMNKKPRKSFSLCSDFVWRNWLPFADQPVMHGPCMLLHLGGISTRTFIRLKGWGEGQMRLVEYASDLSVPWRVWYLCGHRCGWHWTAVTLCVMRSHQPVGPGKEPHPCTHLPSWPHVSNMWWLISRKLCVIKLAPIAVLTKAVLLQFSQSKGHITENVKVLMIDKKKGTHQTVTHTIFCYNVRSPTKHFMARFFFVCPTAFQQCFPFPEHGDNIKCGISN